MDPALSAAERRAAFESRADWFRFLEGSFAQQINQMVTDFGRQGVVTAREGPQDGAQFPSVFFVESEVGYD